MVSGQNGYQSLATNGDIISASWIPQLGEIAFATQGQNWGYSSCIGFRAASIVDSAFTALNVGDTINYVNGFRILPTQNAQASPLAQGESDLMSYILLDLAVALTVSATAVSAVASLAF